MAGVELQKFANVIQCDMKCKINNNNKKQQKTVSCFAASTVRTARLAEFKLLGHVILTAVLETHIKHFATKKIFGELLRGRHVRDVCIHLHILPRSWRKQILVNASFKFVLVTVPSAPTSLLCQTQPTHLVLHKRIEISPDLLVRVLVER